MKPKFTPEFIKEKQYEISKEYWFSDNGMSDDKWMITWCLDEIVERNKRIEELEAERHVYCTGDGDYPAHGEMVMFEDDGIIYIGGYMEEDNTWFTDDGEEFENKPIARPIYWERITGLKEKYEKQKRMTMLPLEYK